MSPLFQYLEQEVIADIARRISKTMKYTRTAENMAVSMYRKGYSPAYIRKEAMKKLNADKDFRKEVAKNTVEYKKEISKLIQKIENDAYKAGDKILAAAGDMAWYDDLAVWKQAGKLLTTSASTLSMLVDGIKKQTKGEMKNLTRTLGFKTKSGFASVRNAYRNELDKAMIKLMSGTFSQEQVFNDTVRNLAQSGIKTVTYGNRAENLDVAVSRALRTGAHQIAGEIQNNNIKEMGENLVYVQEHAGARNTGVGVANHEEWQGKVYYIKPGTDYSEEAKRVGQQNIEDLWECTGYSVDNMHINDPAGLFGYNCRHLYNVWFEGISSLPAKQPVKPPVVWNGKVLDFYAQTQEARKQERNIRALKRERDALERTGQDTTEIKKKLSDAGRKYKQFCKVCKFPPNTTRTRYESGTADLTKTKAYREYKQEKGRALSSDNSNTVISAGEESRTYIDITDKLKYKEEKEANIKTLDRYIVEDKEYMIDGINVIQRHDDYEKGIANMISSSLHKEVSLVPEITGKYKNISAPDFEIDGKKFDLKKLNGESKDAIRNAIKRKEKQADNFIIDISDYKLDNDAVTQQIDTIFNAYNTKFVNSLTIIENGKIKKIVKRK